MGEFKFSLQSVLNHRHDIETECKNEYRQAQQNYLKECEKVQQLRQTIENFRERLMIKGKVTISELQQLNGYQEQLRQKLIEQERVKAKSQQVVEVAQSQLLQARVEAQVIEKLEEKQYEAYCHQAKIEENKMLDELACIKYGRL